MSEQKYGPNTAKVEAFLALLPKLTDEQREAAHEAGWDASWSFEWHVAADAALGAAEAAERIAEWDAAEVDVRPAASRWRVAGAWAASWAAVALVMRDIITQEQFDALTAPMRATGIDFDALTPTTNRGIPNTADWRDDPANAWCKVCDRGLEGCTHDSVQVDARLTSMLRERAVTLRQFSGGDEWDDARLMECAADAIDALVKDHNEQEKN